MVCWDSQLRDSTRILLTRKYNDYRREVARGTCPRCNIREKYQYMCEMVCEFLNQARSNLMHLIRKWGIDRFFIISGHTIT